MGEKDGRGGKLYGNADVRIGDTYDESWMAPWKNNRARSVEVWDGCHLYAYEKWHFGGRSIEITHRDMQFRRQKFSLYLNLDFGPAFNSPTVWPASAGFQWTDNISSFKCRCESWVYRTGARGRRRSTTYSLDPSPELGANASPPLLALAEEISEIEE